jgi:GT2 family glycosyltransferase
MKVAIIIVNFNASQYTRECLASLNKLKINNIKVKILVVDNGSSEKLEIKKDDFKDVGFEIIRSEENLGFSGGNNLAIEKNLNDFDYFLVLNNDTIHNPDFLQNLVEDSIKNDADISSPKIYFAKGREFHKDKYNPSELGKIIWYAGGLFDKKNVLAAHRGVDDVDQGQFDKPSETDFATGCCMLIKKDVFEKIGIFDMRYFLYLEDLELSFRAKKKGFKIFYIPTSVIWHINAGSTGGSGSQMQDYFISRNRLLFGFAYSDLRARLALFNESLRLLLNGREMQKKGIKDFYLRNFGKGSLNL